MKLAIIDKIGLCYDGTTLSKKGLGGSESAVILIAKNLQNIGFEVTVYNNCKDGSYSEPGIYDGVKYIDNSEAKNDTSIYDIVIVSRTALPFMTNDYPFLHTAKKKVLWLHDTFIEGDNFVEDLVVSGKIDHIFTLSDWHTSYILTCAHGRKRNYEVLKRSVFQTRNGAVCHIPEVDLKAKDPNLFVYNASATKGLIPLVEHIWPEIKKTLPEAKLSIIGGYYRFREGAKPDAQENTISQLAKRQDLKNLGVTFHGVIPQYEIAEILSKSWMMLYPGAFPETFGISSLESLLYKTPLVTTRFGALEETAIDLACYHIDYAIEPNNLFPEINKQKQVLKFLQTFFEAYKNTYLHQQKQNYCDVVKDIAGWDTVALQWKQFFYSITGNFLSVDEYREVSRINDKVTRVFGRTSIMTENKKYQSYSDQRKIVVISPFWNAENYIRNNILSVAQQDYNNYVHILIDDASDDNSYQIAKETIETLPDKIQSKFRLIRNSENKGAIANQIIGIGHCTKDDIVMLLDGDDWLINNNTIFHYYNDLYDQGYEFTYGSMWSLVDNIPLISQEFPIEVKKTRSYRNHHFNWKIPYTHLRTSLAKYFLTLDTSKFKVNGEWMKSGHDNPLFYELIEQVDPNKVYCNREIVCNYNDVNPLNDYKIRGSEQNRNANLSYGKDKVSVVIPTMWRSNILFKKSLDAMIHHNLVDEIIIINNDISKTPDWELLNHYKIRLLNQTENIKVNPAWNLGVSESKNETIYIINDDLFFDVSLFDKISQHKDTETNVLYGFIVGDKNLNQTEITDGSISFEKWKPGIINYGFGQLMVIQKKNWTPIIPELEVYFGDDFILYSHMLNKSNIYLISNMNYEEDFGATSKDLNLSNEYYEKEKPIYFNWQTRNPLGEDLKMKTILVAIPTNKYIEPETFKSIYDLDVPDGYKLEFQYFYGYSRSQILNLICDWAKRYDFTIILKKNVVLSEKIIEDALKTESDLVSIDDATVIIGNRKVFSELVKYPHFINLETENTEMNDFINRSKEAGASFSHIIRYTKTISKSII